MAVPETSMDEYQFSQPRKYQVWSPRKIPAMQAKAMAQAMREAANYQFWF